MNFIIRPATPDDDRALIEAGGDVFDGPADPATTREFLSDPRHCMTLAIAGGRVVGFASGFIHLHPDKAPQLFVAEAGVADEFQGRGIGRELVRALCEHGRKRGCQGAWVATEPDNFAARKAYAAAGGKLSPEPFVMFEFDLANAPGGGRPDAPGE